MLDKTVAVTAQRISAAGGRLVSEARCEHAVPALAERIRASQADLVLIAGASAITDRRDVLPAAIEAAGGTVEHFGMPVDPGNLLLLARQGERPVLGLPGCARSPKLNGFDWVLQRLAAGIPVQPRRHHGHGRRRPADGDPDAAAAARCRPARQQRRARPGRGDRAGRRPVAPHGRGQQAAGAGRRPADGQPHGRCDARLARLAGDRGDRPRGRAGARGARRPAGAVVPQSGLCRRPQHLAAGRASTRCPRSRACWSRSPTCRASRRPRSTG